jgi:Trypsin
MDKRVPASNLPLLLALPVFILTLACEGPPADEQSESTGVALIQGTPTVARPEVGRLTVEGYGCTATLISSRHILTAGHCFFYRPQQLAGADFRIDFLWGGSHTARVERLMWLGHSKVGFGNAGPAFQDVAVGRLDNPIPEWMAAPPAVIRDHGPRKGDLLTSIGYGFGTKRFRSFIKGNNIILEPGDSGGPVFMGSLNDNGPIVLLGSHLFEGPGVTDRDLYGEPHRYLTEIQDVMNAFETDGVCYRAFIRNVGWSTFRCNGSWSETAGRELNGIQIWSPTAGRVCYSSSPQFSEVCDGNLMGFMLQPTPRHSPLRDFRVRLATNPHGKSIRYQAILDNRGLMPETGDNAPIAAGGLGWPIQQFRVWLQ